jgi:TonB family protein
MFFDFIPIAAPETQVLVPQGKRPAVRAAVRPTPQPPLEQPEPPRVTRTMVFAPMVAPQAKRAVDQQPEAPQLDQGFADAKFEAPAEPARPREPVKTGVMTTGSTVAAKVDKPIEQVQTGGFGDTHGLPGEANPDKRANIGHLGSPALPPGPGYGNGGGGATGVRGTVASSGFGNGVAIAPPAAPGVGRDAVKAGGFSTAEVGSETVKPKQNTEPAAAVQPVIILEKPNPVYSDEARRLGIEGEVLVQVVFPVSGGVQVVRVIKGLGHGLDEAAIRAAQQIRFKPSLQDGKPVDFPATVHIMFQLAF